MHYIRIMPSYFRNRLLDPQGGCIRGAIIPYLAKLHIKLQNTKWFHADKRGIEKLMGE